MKDNSMVLIFPSRSTNEAFARTAVAAFVAQLDPTVEELCDIRTAVSEAVTNCIIHAYPDEIGKVYIAAKIVNNLVTVRIRDTGCGIDDVHKAMEPLYTSSTGGERAGLGFAVMLELMDKVRVSSKPGRGTTVVMERRITAR